MGQEETGVWIVSVLAAVVAVHVAVTVEGTPSLACVLIRDPSDQFDKVCSSDKAGVWNAACAGGLVQASCAVLARSLLGARGEEDTSLRNWTAGQTKVGESSAGNLVFAECFTLIGACDSHVSLN